MTDKAMPRVTLSESLDPASELAGVYARQIAEEARVLYWAVATSEDSRIAGAWTQSYQRAVRFFKAAIDFAYPDVPGGAEAVYEIFGDCNESVAHCVEAAKADALDRREGRLINAYLNEFDAFRLDGPRADAVRKAYQALTEHDLPEWVRGLDRS